MLKLTLKRQRTQHPIIIIIVIAANVKEMAIVEIDPLLVKHLSIRADFTDIRIIHGDILMQDIEEIPITNPVRVVGNIPYNITSSIIFWLIGVPQ